MYVHWRIGWARDTGWCWFKGEQIKDQKQKKQRKKKRTKQNSWGYEQSERTMSALGPMQGNYCTCMQNRSFYYWFHVDDLPVNDFMGFCQGHIGLTPLWREKMRQTGCTLCMLFLFGLFFSTFGLISFWEDVLDTAIVPICNCKRDLALEWPQTPISKLRVVFGLDFICGDEHHLFVKIVDWMLWNLLIEIGGTSLNWVLGGDINSCHSWIGRWLLYPIALDWWGLILRKEQKTGVAMCRIVWKCAVE